MAERQNNDEVVSVPMARSDIADYLGLTTETVSRTFTKLKVEGLIALPTPNNVEILDRDQLEDFAAGQTTSEL
jgi:CRP/FNR family transcriptional regulator, anaerobic regulatory protein